jgi:hypothetical protein
MRTSFVPRQQLISVPSLVTRTNGYDCAKAVPRGSRLMKNACVSARLSIDARGLTGAWCMSCVSMCGRIAIVVPEFAATDKRRIGLPTGRLVSL